jgi:UDP-GlcNAc:undecaprenyl-phosphate GlcNAc-1-phosphate transferase
MPASRMIAIALPLLTAFGLSVIAVPVCRRVALRLGFVAHPREDRWHRRTVALFGGVAIAIVFALCAATFGVVRQLPALTVTTVLMFAVGFADDVLSLKPATKLIAQIALASALLLFDFRLHWLESMTLDTLLTLFWVVGLTNAFNLIDNMDGLCAGVALIVGFALLVHLLPDGAGPRAFYEARFLAILIGAVGGFLIYNVHPASVFMGDSGSLFLGFSFAAITLSSGSGSATRSDILPIVAGPVLVLLFPIFDTTLVTMSRWVSGRRASQGGRDHASHRLVAIGLSERRAVFLLWLLAAGGGAFGVGVGSYGQQSSVLLAASVFVLGVVLFAAYLAGIHVYDESDERIAHGTFTPIVVEFMYKRRVAEVLLDFCLIVICYYAAYRLRFEDPGDFLKNFAIFMRSLPVIVAAQMLAFFAVGVYRGVWRHFGMSDTLVVARGVFLGVAAALLVILGVFKVYAYSRTVFAIYAVLLLLAVTLSRASLRLVGEFLNRQRQSSGRRVVIYGAGDSAGLAVREILTGAGDVRVAGFIDDDPRKAGVRVAGYPVLGGYSALTVLVRAASIDSVVISARTLSPERLNNLEVLCAQHQIELSRLRIRLEPLVEGQSRAAKESAAMRQIRS